MLTNCNIAIIGPGALGCLFAALLSKHLKSTKGSLCLLDHNISRANQINKQGIIYEKNGIKEHIRINAHHNINEIPSNSIFFFCVKSYDLKASLVPCKSVLNNDSIVILMQNGISHLDITNQLDLKTNIAYGCTSEGATLIAPGHIRHAGSGNTFLGFINKCHKQSVLQQLTDAVSNDDFAISSSKNLSSYLWTKLIINAAINPLTAIHNCPNGDLLKNEKIFFKMKQITEEASLIASKMNIKIQGEPFENVISVCKKTALNISSMLQDVRNKRLTEIDSINGAIVDLGKKMHIKTPANSEMVKLIVSIQRKN